MKIRLFSAFFLPFLYIFLCPGYERVCLARPSRLDDASFAFNQRTTEFDVAKDGTYTYRYFEEIEVLKEGRKQEIGTRRIPYNSRTSKMTVLKAEVTNGTQTQKVDPKYIEDKPLSSNEQGFDDFNQLTVAYPDVRLGSKLTLQFQVETHEVPFQDHFSERAFFGAEFLQRAGKMKVRSALPLFLEKNDPSNQIEVQQKMDGSIQETEIILKGPLYFDEANEYRPRFTFNDMTWVTVSTHSDYAQLVSKLSPRYEETLRAQLPPGFKAIVDTALNEKTTVDQINRVTSLLAQRVRYTGDWRPIHGGHVPRPLEVIERTGFGDCKDLSTSTVAILRAIGIESNVAWVERDLKPNDFPKLALQSAFNHAIAWARKGDQVFWIDATNLQSFAQGVFEDIGGRPALLIDSKNPRWEKISEGDASRAVSHELRRVHFLKDGTSRISCELELKGCSAVDVTGAGLRDSTDVLRYRFATMLSRESDILSYHVDLDDVNSRITHDHKFKIHVDEKRSASLTTAGQIYRVSPHSEISDLLTIDPKERVSGYFIGHPKTDIRDIILENVALVGTLPTACRIQSPWLSLSRSFSLNGKNIRVQEEVRLQKLSITGVEIRSSDFARFQASLKRCYNLTGLIFKPLEDLEKSPRI